MKKTIWDIEKGEKYFRIFGGGEMICYIWQECSVDLAYRDNFSAFLTKEEAIAELEERKKKALALKPILDDAERRYLKAVIRPFRDKVKYICKRSRLSGKAEYIIIALDDDYTYLPCFKTDTMYQGMEHNRRYTLEELGL